MRNALVDVPSENVVFTDETSISEICSSRSDPEPDVSNTSDLAFVPILIAAADVAVVKVQF